MRKFLPLLLLWGVSLFAQTPAHSVSLTWTSADTQPDTFSVYKLSGVCPTGSLLASSMQLVGPLVTGLTVPNYTDNNVTAGATYCYSVTATYSGFESGFAIPAGVVIPVTVSVPTNLKVTPK